MKLASIAEVQPIFCKDIHYLRDKYDLSRNNSTLKTHSYTSTVSTLICAICISYLSSPNNAFDDLLNIFRNSIITNPAITNISTTYIELVNVVIGRQYIEYWVFKMQLHNISTIQSKVYIIKEKYKVFISSYSLPTTRTTLQGFRYIPIDTSSGCATNGGSCL